MKRKYFLVFAAAMLLCTHEVKAADTVPMVSAESAIVYDADYGLVLWEKNADSHMLIASTTKIMTALIALEQCDLEDIVVATREMASVEGSSMYLQAGEVYTVRELLYGLMLASGNDAATAIAIHVADTEERFADLMNTKARELGLLSTNFENPHGLDGEHHYSTAFDMARLAAYAMENTSFAEIVGTRYTTIKGLTYVNHNKLLWQCEGVTGLKTGYTKAAGRTLVTACERSGHRLICVTLSAPNDWQDHANLYDWAFSTRQERILVNRKTQFRVPVVASEKTCVAAEPLSDVSVFAEKTANVDWGIELPRFVFAPIHIGDKAGRIIVTLDGKAVEEVPLVYMENYSIEIQKNRFPMVLRGWMRKLIGN